MKRQQATAVPPVLAFAEIAERYAVSLPQLAEAGSSCGSAFTQMGTS
jgi:hypothetical protein